MTMIRRKVLKSLAVILLTTLIASCDPFGLRDVLEAASRSALSIEPRSVEMPAGATVRFTADGGVSPYAYSSAGDGSIDPVTGVYTADLSAGSATITVTDAAGTTTSTQVDVEPLASGLHIVPSSITVVVNADVTFAAVGGTPLYSYAITSTGSGSPAIDPVSGDYTAGSSIGVDQVTVTDATFLTATATINVVALTSAVDYDVTSVLALPLSGVAGSAIGAGTFTVQNVGAGNGAAPVGWKVYLSTNDVLDGGDLVVDEGSLAALTAGGSTVIPLSGSWPTAPIGGGFLVVSLDAVDDTTPANDTQPWAFTLEPRPVDYDVLSVTWTSGEYTGQAVDGSFSFKNMGSLAGASTVYWYVYASIDTDVGVGDYLLQGGSRPAMAAGETDGYPIDAVWPTTANPYHLLVKVWAVDDIDAGNDTGWTSAISVTGEPPAVVDYQAAAPVNTGATVAGEQLDATFLLSNSGTDAGSQPVNWTVYLSSNSVLDLGTDPPAAAGTHAALAGSGSDTVAFTGTWPSSAGTWWLFAVVSVGDDVDPLDNSSTGTGVPVAAPNVDYVIQTFAETSGLVAGDPILGDFRIRNSGTKSGAQPLGWTVYLSQDAILDPAGDLVVDAGTLAALGPGASSAITSYEGTWPVVPAAPWPWELYLVASAADDVNAGNNTSGTLARTTVSPQADYDVMTVMHTAGTTAGQAFTGSFTVKNLGPHDGTQAVPWSAYLSDNAVYDAGVDTLVDTGVTASLPFNITSGGISFDGTWPAGAADWYLVIVIDAGDDPASGNDWAASGMVSVTAPNVNYDVLVVSNTGATTAGGSLAGEFTVKNIGTYAGTRTVYWTAYRSDDATLTVGTDPVIDSGSTTALGPGVTSSAIPFTNTWPAAIVVKNYWLFVRVFVADDILAADDTGMSAMVVVNPPNIDYDVIVVNNTGGLVAGGPLGGTIQIQNIGSVDGSRAVYWSVYRSLDMVFTPGVDPIIDSGSIPGGLTAGDSANPSFGGSWPEDTIPRTYYYHVRLTAADDISAANDTGYSAEYVVNPPVAFPDYRVESPVVQTAGAPGGLLSTSGVHSFRVREAAGYDGTKTVNWKVYVSRDATLDGTDTLLASGTTGALGANLLSAPIPFDGTWPAFPTYYRLLVNLDADDDPNPANDTWVSPKIEVPYLFTEGGEDNSDSGPTPPNFADVSDYGITLEVDQLIRINGTMDTAGNWDTYRITAGVGQTSIEIQVLWTSGFDDCDVFLWNESGGEVKSQDVSTDMEPDSPPLTIIGLTPGNRYYIGVFHYRAGGARITPDPYRLYLHGLP